jgi:hypothetical protein
MRTVLIKSPNGRPITTKIIDAETGEPLRNVKHIEFGDLHVDMSEPWTATLHRYVDADDGKWQIENDEFVIEQEEVYVTIGELE